MAKRRPKGVVRLLLGLSKSVAIVVGFPATVFCIMAMLGRWSWLDAFWLRGLIAMAIAIVVPVTLIDRLLPDDDSGETHGIPTDVMALCYLAAPLCVLGFLYPQTKPAVMREAGRLHEAGWVRTAHASYWLTKLKLQAPPQRRDKKPSQQPQTPAPKNEKIPVQTKIKKPPMRRSVRRVATQRKGGSKTPAMLFKECAPSIVSVRTNNGGGTGFLIDQYGTIATNEHVIRNGNYVRIKLYNYGWVDRVELLSKDRKLDLALLRIHTDHPLRPLKMGNSSQATVGARVISIGNPLGLEHTLTDGLISARRIYRGRKMIQMSAPVSPGNSGGPIINMKGEVLGVTTLALHTGIFNRAQNLNMAVPINALKERLKDEYPKRKWIGRKHGKRGGTW